MNMAQKGVFPHPGVAVVDGKLCTVARENGPNFKLVFLRCLSRACLDKIVGRCVHQKLELQKGVSVFVVSFVSSGLTW
jgi:hypothetical protein